MASSTTIDPGCAPRITHTEPPSHDSYPHTMAQAREALFLFAVIRLVVGLTAKWVPISKALQDLIGRLRLLRAFTHSGRWHLPMRGQTGWTLHGSTLARRIDILRSATGNRTHRET